MKRVFIIVLDSCGVGYLPDAASFGDEGANTMKSISASPNFNIPNLTEMGLGLMDGVDYIEKTASPTAAVCRSREQSMGKDTTIGHWEIAGMVSPEPLPTYPDGFPEETIRKLEYRFGRHIVCNRTYSGTEVIKDYGKHHQETGDLIVYTSADSVLQIAAHEDKVPIGLLYRYCRIARELTNVGRIIARPFEGEWPYVRTSRRHDFSLVPPRETMLDAISGAGLDVLSIGKINDIFAGKGITDYVYTSSNRDGMEKTSAWAERDFNGLCFTNLVEFDSSYGHRRNIDGYAQALSDFDEWLPSFTAKMQEDDVLIITADHGCDPGYTGTDHTREYIPIIIYGQKIKPGNYGTLTTYADIAATACDLLGLPFRGDGHSIAKQIVRD